MSVRASSVDERSTRPIAGRRARWLPATDSTAFEVIALIALIAFATAFYMHYALRVGSYQPDEQYYMQLAHYVSEHFPSGLWQKGIWFRGIQRLDQLILALPFAVASGASVYQLGHLIQTLLYASTAIPVWLLARSAGLGRGARALATVLALITPWAIVSTSFLAESVAYPIYAWSVYLTWRVARTPSARGEVVALVVLVLAALSRTALIALAPMLPLAALWQQWRWELRELPVLERLRRLPGALWARHRVLSVVVVVAVVVFVVSDAGLLPNGGLSVLAGNYGLPHLGNFGNLLERYDEYLSRMAMGTALIASVLGLAWCLRELARPDDRDRHALAVVALLGVAMILLSLVKGGPDERYVLYSSMPIGLAFAAELDARLREGPMRISVLRAVSAVVGAAVVIALVALATWPPAGGPYGFFAYASATFYRRAVLERVAGWNLPLVHSHVTIFVIVLVALLAAVWIGTGVARRLARPAAVVFAVGVLAACAIELVYTMQKFTTNPVAQDDGANAAKRSWVVGKVPASAEVATIGIGLGEVLPDYEPIWEATEFWNADVQASAAFDEAGIYGPPIGGRELLLTVHSPGGAVTAINRGAPGVDVPLTRYLLLPLQAANPYGFAGHVVADSPYLPVELLHTSDPPRVGWSIEGISDEGFMAPRKPAVATVYGGALAGGARCASFNLVAPPAFRRRWPFSVFSGSRAVAVHGLLSAEEVHKVEVRLHPISVRGGKLARVKIDVHGQVPYPNGAVVSAQVQSFAVGRCPATNG